MVVARLCTAVRMHGRILDLTMVYIPFSTDVSTYFITQEYFWQSTPTA
jgi:hypothetical protein